VSVASGWQLAPSRSLLQCTCQLLLASEAISMFSFRTNALTQQMNITPEVDKYFSIPVLPEFLGSIQMKN
jgi:hypothetical protein